MEMRLEPGEAAVVTEIYLPQEYAKSRTFQQVFLGYHLVEITRGREQEILLASHFAVVNRHRLWPLCRAPEALSALLHDTGRQRKHVACQPGPS